MNVYSMYGTVYTYIVLASSGRRGASTLKQAHATDSAILPGHAASLKSLDLVLVLPSNTRESRPRAHCIAIRRRPIGDRDLAGRRGREVRREGCWLGDPWSFFFTAQCHLSFRPRPSLLRRA